jgi:hypothetical protein
MLALYQLKNKSMNKLILFFSLIVLSFTSFGQKKINQTLSKQIDSLRDEDQKPVSMKPADRAAAEFQLVIRRNFPLVKSIIDQYGFPGYDLVGKESSHNYWMLVQHSDFDLPFQKRALILMKVQLDKHNASGQDYAYLIDRIALNEGHQQVYGTQINMSEKGTTIKPCIDTLNLDKRRLSVGLNPIKDYLKRCDSVYHEINKKQ